VNNAPHKWLIAVSLVLIAALTLAWAGGAIEKKTLSVIAWIALVICVVIVFSIILQMQEWAKP
jgi:amino acid permease